MSEEIKFGWVIKLDPVIGAEVVELDDEMIEKISNQFVDDDIVPYLPVFFEGTEEGFEAAQKTAYWVEIHAQNYYEELSKESLDWNNDD